MLQGLEILLVLSGPEILPVLQDPETNGSPAWPGNILSAGSAV